MRSVPAYAYTRAGAVGKGALRLVEDPQGHIPESDSSANLSDSICADTDFLETF